MWPGYPPPVWTQPLYNGNPYQCNGQKNVNEVDNWAALARQWANQHGNTLPTSTESIIGQNQPNAYLLPPPPPPLPPHPPLPPVQISMPQPAPVMVRPSSLITSEISTIDSLNKNETHFNQDVANTTHSWSVPDHAGVSERRAHQSYDSGVDSDQPFYNIPNNYGLSVNAPELVQNQSTHNEHYMGDNQAFYQNEHLNSAGYKPSCHGAYASNFNPNYNRMPYQHCNYDGSGCWPRNVSPTRPPFANRFESPAHFDPNRPVYNNFNCDQMGTVSNVPNYTNQEGINDFHNYGDHDYRILFPSPAATCELSEPRNDVQHPTKPNVRMFPSALDHQVGHVNKGPNFGIKPKSSRNPRARISHLPVPEHLMSAFEEAAASTGAWPVKGSDGDLLNAGANAKRKALPAWLRDELEKLEKKKAKELAAVSGDADLGAAPDAERDAEGDIVMEEDEHKLSHRQNSASIRDDLSDEEDESRFDGSRFKQEYGRENSFSRHSSSSSTEAPVVDDDDLQTRMKDDEYHSFNKTSVKRITTDNLLNAQLPTVIQPLSAEEFRFKFTRLSDDEQREETTRFITRTLTEALLDVTNELISSIAQEVCNSETKTTNDESTVSVSETKLDSPAAVLVAYNSESDRESDGESKNKKKGAEAKTVSENQTSEDNHNRRRTASSDSSSSESQSSVSDTQTRNIKHRKKEKDLRKYKGHCHSRESHHSRTKKTSSRHMHRHHHRQSNELPASSSSRESSKTNKKSKHSRGSSKRRHYRRSHHDHHHSSKSKQAHKHSSNSKHSHHKRRK